MPTYKALAEGKEDAEELLGRYCPGAIDNRYPSAGTSLCLATMARTIPNDETCTACWEQEENKELTYDPGSSNLMDGGEEGE